jgi:hypothetical protein
MAEGARILMGDTRHGSLQPHSVVALGGTLAYISPGTSAYSDECLYSHSGLLLCSRTRKPYPSFLVYFLCAITSVRYNSDGNECIHGDADGVAAAGSSGNAPEST